MSEQQGNIEDIFREALASHEMPVSPGVWEGIQASLAGAATTSAVASGSAFLGKAAAVIGMAGVLTFASISEYNYHNNADRVAEVKVEQSSADDRYAIPQLESGNESAVATESALPQKQAEEDTPSAEGTLNGTDTKHSTDAAAERATRGADDRQSAEIRDDQPSSTQTAENVNPIPSEDKEDTPETSGTPVEQETADPEDEQGAETTSATPVDDAPEQEPGETLAYFTHPAEQVITPNGDPYNEFFEIEGYGVQSFYLRIMTRSGKVVFESSDINVRWNGVDRFGNNLPSGVYFYEIQAIGTDDLPYLDKNAKGSITIVRN